MMTRRIGRIAFLLLAGASLLLSGGHTADAAETIATTTQTAAAPEEKKPEPRAKLTELFRVELRQRRLDVTFTPPAWAIKPAGGSSTSMLAEGAGDDRWDVDADSNDRQPDGTFRVFRCSSDDRWDDRYSLLHLSLVSRDEDDAVSIAGAGRADNNLWVLVNLTQDANGGLVHFSVQRPRRRMRPIHEFDAPDLLSLWNDHPKELRQFLLPLLREMTGKNALAPQPGDVYRAFASIPADEATMQKLTAILPALDAEERKDRELAGKQIEALGPAGVLAAARVDPATLTPEQRGRLEALVNSHSTTADPAASAKRDPLFLADCLEDPDAKVRTAALEALRTMTGRPIAFDVSAGDPADRATAAAAVVRALPDFTPPGSDLTTAQPAAGFNP